ncbi:MAG TPA: thioredoxin family protein [Chitinophagaceae bacterium]|nr:thioredoxin family protein [Chitinophagaceae bacterium]
MKLRSLFFAVAAILFSTGMYAQAPPLSADQVMSLAYQQAAKEKKNVLVIFHASWCVWCHRMDSSMADPTCKKFFDDNYVVRHLVVDESKDKKDLENPGADEMRNKYGGKDLGIPYWLIFDANGKLLANSRIKTNGSLTEMSGDNSGCPASANEVVYFINVLKKTSDLNTAQQAAIEKRFRDNEPRYAVIEKRLREKKR